APTGALTAMMFTPEESKAALAHFASLEPSIWGKYGFANAFNADRHWVGPDVIGIDQGALLLGIENHRTGLLWTTMAKNAAVRRALEKIGFQPGTTALKIETQPSCKVMRASAPVKIDGKLDEWASASGTALKPPEFLESGAIQDGSDCSANVRYLWDDSALYVLIEVKDDDVVQTRDQDLIWKDDCVEFYVDPAGDGLVWNDPKDFQIGFAPGSSTGESSAKTWAWFQKRAPTPEQVKAVATRTADGYTIEAAISWLYLGIQPKAGLVVNASPAIHDRDEKVASEGKLMWAFDEVGDSDARRLGRLELAP
ncbi:MAG: hypothetical protein JO317_01695, partial [Verrucomicrobiae bacterium]|nr:hypothetical protein [Verrucomicrobiae bacterium]